jgi:hypothetical protein
VEWLLAVGLEPAAIARPQQRQQLPASRPPAAVARTPQLLRSLCRTNSLTAHLITPAKGPHFTMYLVQMKAGGKAPKLAAGVER